MTREDVANELDLLIDDVLEAADALAISGERIAHAAGQTRARWSVLRHATSGGLSVAAIARRLNRTRQSVQRIADLLAEDGLVRYRPNPDHQRSPLVELTPAGQQVLDQINHTAQQYRLTNPDLDGFTLEEFAPARALLKKLTAASRNTASMT